VSVYSSHYLLFFSFLKLYPVVSLFLFVRQTNFLTAGKSNNAVEKRETNKRQTLQTKKKTTNERQNVSFTLTFIFYASLLCSLAVKANPKIRIPMTI
jgi:biopolymer transport protein ExbB/TolQ